MPHKHPKRTEQPISYNIPSYISEGDKRAIAEYTRKMCEEDKAQCIDLTWESEDDIHAAQVWIKTKDDEPYIPEFLSKPLHTTYEEINTYEERVIDELSSLPQSSTTVYDNYNKRNRQLNINDEQVGILPRMPHKIPVERKLSYLSSGDPTGITYLR